jgi:hypothetical protein
MAHGIRRGAARRDSSYDREGYILSIEINFFLLQNARIKSIRTQYMGYTTRTIGNVKREGQERSVAMRARGGRDEGAHAAAASR